MRNFRVLLITGLGAVVALGGCVPEDIDPVVSDTDGTSFHGTSEGDGALDIMAAQSNVVRTYLQGDLGRLELPRIAVEKTVSLRGAEAALYAAASPEFLHGHVALFLDASGTEEFEAMQVRQDKDGVTLMRHDQRINGLPVVGAQLLVIVDKEGVVTRVNGEFVRDLGLAVEPQLSADQAMASALEQAGIESVLITSDAKLAYVIGSAGKAVLAWSQTVDYTDEMGPQRDLVFADAVTGEVAARHPRYHYARSLRTYDCNNGTSCGSLVSSSSNAINTGDDAADAAHNYAIATYDYYLNNHGRDSIDDNGMTLNSRVHYSNNYNNAFWNGSQMTYGDGDGTTFIPLSQDADVVAHELTHGVTERSSNLIYANESGALNEALSDIFGAMVDRQEGATGADIWLLGEDIYTPGTPGDGLRDMADPQAEGDYDYWPTRYTGSQDNGGVHWNSGIANLAFVLLVEGGTHPRGTTSNTVPSIGFTKAAAIFYYANTSCLTSSSNFEAARNCTSAGATALYGATEEAAVQEAWDAVGVPGGGGGPGDPPGDSCSDTNIWTGTASSSTPNLVTPSCSASGTFNGALRGDNGAADLDLYLEKESCSGWFGCSFGTAASSTSAGTDEDVQGYNGSSGTYRWRVNWYSGPAEPFHLCTNKC